MTSLEIGAAPVTKTLISPPNLALT